MTTLMTMAARAAAAGAVAMLSGCLATTPSVGGSSGSAATGAAAGGSAEGASSSLERCAEPLGTLRIEENTSAGWYTTYSSRYRTGSTVPALRLLVQQSNCFVIVERGRGLQGMTQERQLIRGEEGRAGSNFGGGQMVAADYMMSPEVILSDKGGTRAGGVLAGIGGLAGTALSAVAGSMSTNEASTILLLVDNRSGVQISASEGYSKNIDFGLSGWGFGGGAAGGAGAFTSTPEGKVLMAAFADSYNKMVVALRSYKAQTVKGGLGTGGRLGVQGGSTDAARGIKK
ncbi:CsgG/HfaB family protein [Sphaerotilus uruguayifluvii]|uniref:Peptidoglycan-binding protein n=1 Tax=Sphaerotilus uruguayifluvii TaxID=2735897 RepID=A0ABX2FZJ6_9BURK|nr:CsgG/HfaB family protein [Leptothrix sp. C29]NRT55453.1 hypothetical protein [Leptothrix sp. C29]